MKLIKKAIEIGNGAAVYVPKEYSGRQIVIILPERAEDIKKRVVERLADHLENVVGVYIFGSYARDESHLLSDIDVLVITRNDEKRLKQLFEDIDARIMTLEQIKKSIERFPALILPILKEAKTVINPVLLDELKNSKINYENFKWNFDDIRRVLKIIETFIEADEEDISISHIYSLVMRARVCYMIESLLKSGQFSNLELKTEMVKRGIDEKTYERYYEIYRRIRDDEKVEGKIDKEEILRFISIIKKYTSQLENESKKAARKRN